MNCSINRPFLQQRFARAADVDSAVLAQHVSRAFAVNPALCRGTQQSSERRHGVSYR